MKFAAIASFLMAASASANPFVPGKSDADAKGAYMGKLMRGARATANSQLRNLNEDYMPDISKYSVKFEQCQFVKAYDDELAEEEEYGSVLAIKRFVIFRLCPSGSCSSCNYNFGEYVIDLEAYLEATVAYAEEDQENMCQACEECYNNGNNNNNQDEDEDGDRRMRRLYDLDCSTCYDECQKIENMEDNGYIEATEFLECQQIYDPEDDYREQALYAGPICASDGTKIKIGVFTDEWCYQHDTEKDVDDYLMDGDGVQMKLSHALLKTTYDPDSCISCEEVDEDNDNNNNNDDQNQDDPEILDMCEQLYEEAAKCEKAHGFDDGFANYYGYENQLAQEGVVCDFITSLQAGTYDEEGEIRVSGSGGSSGGGGSTTGGQKFALTFFILGTVGLAVYAAMLHSKITKGGKADLSSQGGTGAMA